jgi:hypothetical protein
MVTMEALSFPYTVTYLEGSLADSSTEMGCGMESGWKIDEAAVEARETCPHAPYSDCCFQESA